MMAKNMGPSELKTKEAGDMTVSPVGSLGTSTVAIKSDG